MSLRIVTALDFKTNFLRVLWWSKTLMDGPKGNFAGISWPKPFCLERQFLLGVKMECFLLWCCGSVNGVYPSGLCNGLKSCASKKLVILIKKKSGLKTLQCCALWVIFLQYLNMNFHIANNWQVLNFSNKCFDLLLTNTVMSLMFLYRMNFRSLLGIFQDFWHLVLSLKDTIPNKTTFQS